VIHTGPGEFTPTSIRPNDIRSCSRGLKDGHQATNLRLRSYASSSLAGSTNFNGLVGESGRPRYPVTVKIAGPNPVKPAISWVAGSTGTALLS
jgi:hypothetical protein